jgi:hypothetical protein
MPVGLGNSVLLILTIITLSVSTVLRVVLCLASVLSSSSLNPTRFCNTLSLLLSLFNIRFNLDTMPGLS